jgi:nitrile hydratase accessory protein
MPAPPADQALLDALPRLPRDAEGPVFAEPWQAQAFALAVDLSRAGHFTWTEWAAELARVLAEAGAPDDGTAYWTHWQTALERLVLARGLSSAGALDARTEAWRKAYRTTPHGRPVTLPPARS